MTAMPKEMQPQRQAEAEHRAKATVTVAIKSIVTGNRDDADTRDARLVAGRPLPGGQIRDAMTLARQALSEAPVPAFGAADGPGVKPVVGDANPERRLISAAYIER